MNDYCPTCDGDPRRVKNVEPHKGHTDAPPNPDTLPGRSDDQRKGDWLDT